MRKRNNEVERGKKGRERNYGEKRDKGKEERKNCKIEKETRRKRKEEKESEKVIEGRRRRA